MSFSDKKNDPKIIMVSGGFDPVHKGHIKMIRESSEYGEVIVALNSDEWLIRKKGYTFMKWEERAFILSNIKGVKKVISFNDDDGSACDALQTFMPDYFANGGDRFKANTPEVMTCKKLGVEMLWHMGGMKEQSSSELVEAARENEEYKSKR